MNFHIKNFGCRLNQHEGNIIAENLIASGFRRVDFCDADIVIVNGCTVTSRADQKVRQFIHKVRRENPSAKILLTGCTAEAIFKKLLENIPDVEIVPKKWRYDIAGFLKSSGKPEYNDFPQITGKNITRARAQLKIQDGCDRNCAYCIVPFVRKNSRSRNADDIIEQVIRLTESGFKEIVLTGVDIGDWHDGEMSLSALLKKILAETDICRVRLSSIEPPGITDELIALISTEQRIAPHLHIPLQSGSENILWEMKRPHYSIPALFAKLDILRNARPELCIGTDIIAGYPAESDDDFAQTKALLESGKIAYTHLFRFSPRPGTIAQKLKQLPSKISNERMRILQEIDRANRTAFAQRFVGRKLDVLVETVRDGKIFGHTANYIRIIASGAGKRREFIKILAKSALPMQITGEVIPR